MRTVFAAALLIAGAVLAGPASAERIAGGMSDREISINSSFAGKTVTLFGNVEAETGSVDKSVEGPFDIIVVVTGPESERAVRRKDNRFGIWINAEDTTFSNFPSYKWVLANTKLADIVDPDFLMANNITLDSFADRVEARGSTDVATMREGLVHLMQTQGLFGVDEKGIVFQSDTLYTGQISLPSDVPNGSFLTETFLFKSGQPLARKAEKFVVRKEGFERFIGDAARNFPLLYGLTCVVLAVMTGWLGRLVFRR